MEQTSKIAIAGWGSISPLGVNGEAAWKRYRDNTHCFVKTDLRETKTWLNETDDLNRTNETDDLNRTNETDDLNRTNDIGETSRKLNEASRKLNEAGKKLSDTKEWTAPLSREAAAVVSALGEENLKYRQLDPSVRYAIAASRNAVRQAGWAGVNELGINIGSSRGATTAFEKHHAQFLENRGQFTDPLTSPATTLGNIAGWTASDLNVNGPAISHSITCSTALHALINAVIWLQSGRCSRFLAGGSEAPLTPFTLAQMKALKVYSKLDGRYPCRSMDLEKTQNTMILSEGAASFCLEKEKAGAPAYISGIGYGTETMKHGASLSADALCLQRSMKMALEGHDPRSVQVVVMHAPGTIRGDMAEMDAIKTVFGGHQPLLTSNKWKIGHSFGASGALSVEMALLMLLHDRFIQLPYLPPQQQTGSLKKILVNGVGFGGNAASILLEK